MHASTPLSCIKYDLNGAGISARCRKNACNLFLFPYPAKIPDKTKKVLFKLTNAALPVIIKKRESVRAIGQCLIPLLPPFSAYRKVNCGLVGKSAGKKNTARSPKGKVFATDGIFVGYHGGAKNRFFSRPSGRSCLNQKQACPFLFPQPGAWRHKPHNSRRVSGNTLPRRAA